MALQRRFAAYRFPAIVFAVAVCGFAALLALKTYPVPFLDAKAFYCAGDAFARGEDPYRDAAMRPCERALQADVIHAGPGIDEPTVPAPWPPYTMPVLAALSRLPFWSALVVWTLLDFAALGIAAELLRRSLPQLSPVAIASFVLIAGVPTEAALGQPAGIELLAVVGAGRALIRPSTLRIGAWVCIAALQPYIALPLTLALLCAGKAALRGALAGAFIVVAASFLIRRDLTLEYLFAVAPAHARGNVLEASQLSLTSLIAGFGTPPERARLIGTILYGIAIGVGIWAGRRWSTIAGSREALPWIATMLGVIAAPYLHFQQLACALPGALLVLSASAFAPAAFVSSAGAFVPWVGLLVQTRYSYLIAPLGAGIAWTGARRTRAARVAACAMLLFVADLTLLQFFRAHVHNPAGYRNPPAMTGDLAERSWSSFVALDWASLGVASLAPRAVTAACALLLVALTVYEAWRRRGTPAANAP